MAGSPPWCGGDPGEGVRQSRAPPGFVWRVAGGSNESRCGEAEERTGGAPSPWDGGVKLLSKDCLLLCVFTFYSIYNITVDCCCLFNTWETDDGVYLIPFTFGVCIYYTLLLIQMVFTSIF